MKVCRDRQGRGCGQTLSLDNFYTSNGRPVSVCKRCYRDIYSRNRGNRAARRAASVGTNDRAFGVELELTGPSYATILSALQAAGINVAHIGRYRATNGSTWELKRDCSVRGEGLELVSPKLQGAAGFRELETVCTALRSVGATVDRSCGLHVHHDARGLSARDVAKVAVMFAERQGRIMEMMAPSRRSNTYCPMWDSYQISQLRNVSHVSDLSHIGPRGALNLHAYPRHGSVEFRCHAGTTNFSKIAAWIRFGQALFAAALAGTEVSNENVTQMLSDLTRFGVTTQDAAWLLRFQTAGETRAAVAARVAALQAELSNAESVLEEV